MSERDDREEPRTAAEEVLRAATEAERRTAGSAGHHRGAGEATTPDRATLVGSAALTAAAGVPSRRPGTRGGWSIPLWNPGCPPRAGP